jgi:hypothetical protein
MDPNEIELKTNYILKVNNTRMSVWSSLIGGGSY